jgi:hypothetical protein
VTLPNKTENNISRWLIDRIGQGIIFVIDVGKSQP